jgi:hypothetical protein
MKGMRFTPRGYGGERQDPEQVKRDGWRELSSLSPRITRASLGTRLIRQPGERLCGRRPSAKAARHG